jgi:hypothetical protein
MDYRCPLCGANQKKTRFGQTLVTRMKGRCADCNGAIHLNVHRAETLVVLLNLAILVVLAVFAYWPQRRWVVLIAVAAALVGAAALPVLERTYLRNWPRYTARPPDTKP